MYLTQSVPDCFRLNESFEQSPNVGNHPPANTSGPDAYARCCTCQLCSTPQCNQNGPMEHRDNVLSEDDANRIIDHMNDAHEDDLLLFAQVYGGAAEATAARMTEIDGKGMNLEVTTAEGQQDLRIDFDTPLQIPEDAHRTLVDMALNARE